MLFKKTTVIIFPPYLGNSMLVLKEWKGCVHGNNLRSIEWLELSGRGRNANGMGRRGD